MAFSPYVSNKMVSEADAASAAWPLNSGQSNVYSTLMMTKSAATTRYKLDASPLSSYATNQLIPQSAWLAITTDWQTFGPTLDPTDINVDDDGTNFEWRNLSATDNTMCPISFIPDANVSPVQGGGIELKIASGTISNSTGLEPFDARGIYRNFISAVSIPSTIQQSIHVEQYTQNGISLVNDQWVGFIRYATDIQNSWFNIEIPLNLTAPVSGNCSGNTNDALWPLYNKINMASSLLTTIKNEADAGGVYPYYRNVVINGKTHRIGYNGTATISNITKVMIGVKSNESRQDTSGAMWFNEPYKIYSTAAADNFAPNNVSNVSISNVATTTLTLSWTCSTDNVGIAGYRVFTNGGTTPIDISTTQSSGTISISITGLSPSTSYYFTVRAYDAAGNTNSGTPSATVSTNAVQTTPATPTGLYADASGTQISTGWNTSSGATSYILTRATSLNGTYSTRYNNSGTTYLDNGAQNATYYYKIQASNASGTSAPSAAVSARTGSVNCFVAGTMITLASGLQVLIEELAINDILTSEMIEGLADTNDVNELYKWHSTDLVTSKQFAKIDMIKPVAQDVTWIINGGHLQVTPFHSQLVMRDNVWSFMQVRNIQLGDWLIEDDKSLTEVTSMVLCNDTVIVYPITLSGPHTFYANGILTHNVKIQ